MTLPAVGRAPRVLVIYKKTAWQQHQRRLHGRARVQKLVEARDPSVDRLIEAHEDHLQTLTAARSVLKRLGARATFRHRGHSDQVEGSDLVVTLGGDGTLLWASHLVGSDVPMLAINSAPRNSVGYFCAGTKDDLEPVLATALAGDLRPTSLARMQVDLDGVTLSKRVLNDALFCHVCPAVTSRYLLELGGIVEEQKSSGIWVGPAAGSTAAQRSAGGDVLPLRSRQIQFVVREPYVPSGESYRLTKGLVDPGESLQIRSKMRSGRVFLDGEHRMHEIEIGSHLRLRLSDDPITILGLTNGRLD